MEKKLPKSADTPKKAFLVGYNEGFMKGLKKGREETKFCKKCGLKTYTIEKEETKEDGINKRRSTGI